MTNYMGNLAYVRNYSNVIQFEDIRNKNNGQDDNCNKEHPLAGKSSEGYAFRTKGGIAAMISVVEKEMY